MYISQVGTVCVLVLLLSGAHADWEVLNESTDQVTQDFSLKEDNLLPVAAQSDMARQPSLTSLGHADSKSVGHVPVRVVRLQENQTAASAATAGLESKTKTSSNLPSPGDSANSWSSAPETTAHPSRDEVIDLAGEGLLLVEKRRGQRALGQDVVRMSLDNDRIQPESRAATLTLEVACFDDSSWECQMFKQNLQAMQADQQFSPRASVYERTKRQASSNFKNVDVGSSWSSRNLLDCEDGDCFSGNGTDPADDGVAPVFTFQSSTKMATNWTRATLNDTIKVKLAGDLQDKLCSIFHNISGFKGVKVDPKYVYIDSNGTLRFDDWTVSICGSNETYTGKNGSAVADLVRDAIQGSNEQYKNITIDGARPIDDFNYTKAAEKVEKEANDPCKMQPSPCPVNYTTCKRLAAAGKGIRLRCTDNCINYSDCHNHGQCRKDAAGKPFCKCSDSWIGPYCDKENKTTSSKDDTRAPVFTISQATQFPTSLTNENLTPEIRQELAKQLEDMLKIVFSNFPGIKDVKVNPNDISASGGVLYIPWKMPVDSGNPAYAGKSPENIADEIRNNLQNLGDTYKNNVLINGSRPIDDLDFVDAAQQVEQQARDPCSTNSCALGYSMCEAISATQIKCLHNCNSRPTQCQNGGQCQLDSAGNATCQCVDKFTGADCEAEDSSLDAGQIAGVAVGVALVAAAIAGLACMMIVGARRGQRDVNFTEYTDEHSSDNASNPSNMLHIIDRPEVSTSPLAVYSSSPAAGNYSTPSSYAASNNGEHAPADRYNSLA
ncbi:hypothetical protein BsWGS_18380 [Bradybaena similaris]